MKIFRRMIVLAGALLYLAGCGGEPPFGNIAGPKRPSSEQEAAQEKAAQEAAPGTMK